MNWKPRCNFCNKITEGNYVDSGMFFCNPEHANNHFKTNEGNENGTKK